MDDQQFYYLCANCNNVPNDMMIEQSVSFRSLFLLLCTKDKGYVNKNNHYLR